MTSCRAAVADKSADPKVAKEGQIDAGHVTIEYVRDKIEDFREKAINDGVDWYKAQGGQARQTLVVLIVLASR